MLIKYRQQIDGSIRAHKKQMSSLQSMLTDCMNHGSQFQSKSPSKCLSEVNQLEQGKICVMCKTSHTFIGQEMFTVLSHLIHLCLL